MDKDWFTLPSLDRTIDMNLVSNIQWNKRYNSGKQFCSVIYLGTSIAVNDEIGVVRNELSIFAKEDREKLLAKFPSIPITLRFDEKPLENQSVESANFNIAESETPSAEDSNDIPF